MIISMPPKYAVSQVIGYIAGKSAIHIARRYAEIKRDFVGSAFGPAATSFRPLVETKMSFGSTYRIRNKRIDQSIN